MKWSLSFFVQQDSIPNTENAFFGIITSKDLCNDLLYTAVIWHILYPMSYMSHVDSTTSRYKTQNNDSQQSISVQNEEMTGQTSLRRCGHNGRPSFE